MRWRLEWQVLLATRSNISCLPPHPCEIVCPHLRIVPPSLRRLLRHGAHWRTCRHSRWRRRAAWKIRSSRSVCCRRAASWRGCGALQQCPHNSDGTTGGIARGTASFGPAGRRHGVRQHSSGARLGLWWQPWLAAPVRVAVGWQLRQ